MIFRLLLSPKTNSFLNKLNNEDRKRLEKKLKQLKKNPEIGKPMIGKLTELWSLRVGKYRTLYQIRKSELLILILRIGHRKNIYG